MNPLTQSEKARETEREVLIRSSIFNRAGKFGNRASASFRSLTGTALLVPAMLALLFASSAPVGAALGILFVVNSTGDGQDWFPGDNVCETASGNGVCTLRAAIEEANAHPGTDAIHFNIPTTDPGYNAHTGSYTIGVGTEPLDAISESINISGPGAAKLTVTVVDAGQCEGACRIFAVTTVGTVNISGMTIARGVVFGDAGGGIGNFNKGTLNLTNCTLDGNQAQVGVFEEPGLGGAIYNAGTLNLINCTLKFNQAFGGGSGGGVLNDGGTINITNSTLNDNSADEGGGIFNRGSGVVNVIRSTFRENGASSDGGGISNWSGTMNVTNSTFYANIAYAAGAGDGGGIANRNGSTLNLTNSTVTANFSGAAGSGVSNGSGGIANIKSSIIALNYGGGFPTGVSPDVYGAFSSKGFNLIGKKDGSTGFSMGTDKKGTIASPLDPKFDPNGLRNNGGSTQTIGLLAGSPAIDAGTSAGLTGTLTKDQRGSPRTFDNTAVTNAISGDGTDIGAYERQTQ